MASHPKWHGPRRVNFTPPPTKCILKLGGPNNPFLLSPALLKASSRGIKKMRSQPLLHITRLCLQPCIAICLAHNLLAEKSPRGSFICVVRISFWGHFPRGMLALLQNSRAFQKVYYPGS
eukprot:1148183-Pelagomonas_calceolata.AAC.7